jgi:hypothetical protein
MHDLTEEKLSMACQNNVDRDRSDFGIDMVIVPHSMGRPLGNAHCWMFAYDWRSINPFFILSDQDLSAYQCVAILALQSNSRRVFSQADTRSAGSAHHNGCRIRRVRH